MPAQRRLGRRFEVVVPRPRPYQRDVLAHRARWKMCACGRRWGKSSIAITAGIAGHGPTKASGRPLWEGAVHGKTIWWVVPDMNKTGRERWRDLLFATKRGRSGKNEVEHRIEFPGGGSISVRSADDPDSLVGPALDGVILEEASLMPERVWTQIIRPTLSDTGGWAMFIFTPRGRQHWTHKRWQRGADPAWPDWASWQRPSRENPQLTDDDLAEARRDLGAQLYAQEYEAAFLAGAGGIIHSSHLRIYTGTPPALPTSSVYLAEADTPRLVNLGACTRFAVADLAFSTKTAADWTCVGVFALTPMRELLAIDWHRVRIEGPDLVPLFDRIQTRWKCSWFGIEQVAAQLAIVQQARRSTATRAGLPVKALTPDRDKVSRAMYAGARIEAGGFHVPEHAPWRDDLLAELDDFRSDLAHEHDDQVDVVGYALEQVEVMAGSRATSW